MKGAANKVKSLNGLSTWLSRFDGALLEIERALDAACQQEIRGKRFEMSLRLDALLSVVG